MARGLGTEANWLFVCLDSDTYDQKKGHRKFFLIGIIKTKKIFFAFYLLNFGLKMQEISKIRVVMWEVERTNKLKFGSNVCINFTYEPSQLSSLNCSVAKN